MVVSMVDAADVRDVRVGDLVPIQDAEGRVRNVPMAKNAAVESATILWSLSVLTRHGDHFILKPASGDLVTMMLTLQYVLQSGGQSVASMEKPTRINAFRTTQGWGWPVLESARANADVIRNVNRYVLAEKYIGINASQNVQEWRGTVMVNVLVSPNAADVARNANRYVLAEKHTGINASQNVQEWRGTVMVNVLVSPNADVLRYVNRFVLGEKRTAMSASHDVMVWRRIVTANALVRLHALWSINLYVE
jgi:hypothetical protein